MELVGVVGGAASKDHVCSLGIEGNGGEREREVGGQEGGIEGGVESGNYDT